MPQVKRKRLKKVEDSMDKGGREGGREGVEKEKQKAQRRTLTSPWMAAAKEAGERERGSNHPVVVGGGRL
jgi:hypothetical protein